MKRFFLIVLSLLALFSKAQVNDDFSDGNFTSNPAWVGNTASFAISTGQLNTNGPAVTPSTIYLSTPSTAAVNAQWDFFVNPKAATTAGNFMDIFLMSDSANLLNAKNGYFVRVGNTSDDVCLYVLQNGVNSLIIDGPNDSISSSSNNPTKIRVIRSAANQWTLEADFGGTGNNHVLQGSVNNSSVNSSSYFGLKVTYSASNFNKYFFDDLTIVGGVLVDSIPPSLVSATALSANQLDVFFNEEIETLGAGNAVNYQVSNSVGQALTALQDAVNKRLVHLSFQNNFPLAQNLFLYVSNLQDTSGNVLLADTLSFIYSPIATAGYKDVLINELMADPSPAIALPVAEYLELYNRSSATVDLNNWSLHDDVLNTSPNIGSFQLLPDSFVVLCSTSSAALLAVFPHIFPIPSFPSLNNDSDQVYLRNQQGNIVDSVRYGLSWYKNNVKKDGGWSLELINPLASANCAAASNWIASYHPSGGTPGKQNAVYSTTPDTTAPALILVQAIDSLHIQVCFSEAMDANQIKSQINYNFSSFSGNLISVVPNAALTCADITLSSPLISQQSYTLTINGMTDCSGNALLLGTGSFIYFAPTKARSKEIVITEIYSSPNSVSPLPNVEYLELYNRSSSPVNLNDWSLGDDVATITANLPAFILYPDSFLVVCSTANASLFSATTPVLGISSFPSLNNTGDHIFLRNNQGNLIDDVNYNDTWYRNNSKKQGGWSLELIDAEFVCNNAFNWTASKDLNHGTPGAINSVKGVFSDTQAPELLRAIVTSNSSIKLFFSESVNRAALVDPASYSFSNGVSLNASTFFTVNEDSTEVNIVLPLVLQPQIIYTIKLSSAVSDCSGNEIAADNYANFGMWEEPEKNDVVINEVLSDPITGGSDYIEIYNRSNKIIDLSQLILSSKDTLTNELKSLSTIAVEGYLLMPKSYLLLSENIGWVKQQYGTQNPKGFWQMLSIPSLNISDGTIVLSTPQQKIIDDLHYYESW